MHATTSHRPAARGAILLCVVLWLGVAGCAQAPAGPDAASEGTDPRGPSLWDRITAEHYAEWKVGPGYQVPRPSEGMAHGKRVQIFLNDTAAVAREQALAQWPDGSIIVADVLDDHSIVRVAAMEKRRGSWVFAEWTAEGEPLPAREPGCPSCHGRGTDGTLGVRIGR